MSIASRGASMAVDWEQRVDFDRLRRYRLGRAKASLSASDLGALLLFDPNNLRYVTSTAIGTWERDKNIRFGLVFREDDPILWDFGSAARHHQLYCPWLPESSWRAWVPPMRGAMPDSTGVPDALAEMIWTELHERGLDGEPVGMDVPDMTTLLALQRKGLEIGDSQPVMLEARKIKSAEELALLDQAAGIVDAAYEEIHRMLRPGVRESQIDAYTQCREWLDNAIERVRPGVTTERIAEVWPSAQEIGMKDERAAFGLQFGHGLGVGLYESPMISRLHSFDDPVELEVGMVFALETYCPTKDRRSAARIEEEVVVTPTGPQILTRFPAEELLVAGKTYVRGADLGEGRLVDRDGAASAFGGIATSLATAATPD